MSGPDQGDEDKGFLTRWSQRKQEARQPEAVPDTPAPEAEIPPAAVPEGEAVPEFDLSSLPKLEEMTGATDITGFLQKGVPEHLRNAALRKSWALDPAIRNYVNPALEYAYDWNVPGGVPGSSEIGAGMDVARMVLQIMGDGPAEATASDPKPEPEPANGSEATSEHQAASASEPDLPVEALRRSDEANPGAQNVSAADDPAEAPSAAPQQPVRRHEQPVRRHGSAKPTV